jgi:hypothetical protein
MVRRDHRSGRDPGGPPFFISSPTTFTAGLMSHLTQTTVEQPERYWSHSSLWSGAHRAALNVVNDIQSRRRRRSAPFTVQTATEWHTAGRITSQVHKTHPPFMSQIIVSKSNFRGQGR